MPHNILLFLQLLRQFLKYDMDYNPSSIELQQISKENYEISFPGRYGPAINTSPFVM